MNQEQSQRCPKEYQEKPVSPLSEAAGRMGEDKLKLPRQLGREEAPE